MDDRTQIVELVNHEAALLDDEAYQEWISLFTQDCHYWVPQQQEQENWDDHISLYNEDRVLMETRIRRLNHINAHSQDERARASRLLGHVSVASDGDTASASAPFQMIEFHHGEQRAFAGRVHYALVKNGVGWKIKQKRIDLINCDGIFGPLELFL
jgi:ethylbenzene dioxygenase subunit beta